MLQTHWPFPLPKTCRILPYLRTWHQWVPLLGKLFWTWIYVFCLLFGFLSPLELDRNIWYALICLIGWVFLGEHWVGTQETFFFMEKRGTSKLDGIEGSLSRVSWKGMSLAALFQMTDPGLLKLYFFESWKIHSLQDSSLKMQITLWVHFSNQYLLMFWFLVTT